MTTKCEGRDVRALAESVARLPRRDQRGSRPRCLLLTEGQPGEVSRRLEDLADVGLGIETTSTWAPRGFADTREVSLAKCSEALVAQAQQDELARWWLADPRGRSPMWDAVARGRHGLLLVEAKAHEAELTTERPRAKVSPANTHSIQRALGEATDALDAVLPGWDLVHGPYQLANRIAWAWKLASMGIPVALVYLGFLHAGELDWRRYRTFLNHDAWEQLVRRHARTSVPRDAWGRTLEVGRAWLRLEVRSVHVRSPLPCPACGGQLIPFLYGMPTDEAWQAAEHDDAFRIAGCMISPDSPTHECGACGQTTGRLDELAG